MDDRLADRQVNRRRLLRRAGTVAAGVAGAGVVSGVVATPAQAADGTIADGTFSNDSAAQPTLSLDNNYVGTESAGTQTYATVGPQLRLVPGDGKILTKLAPKGSVAMDEDGYIWVATDSVGGSAYRDFVHTTQNSNLTVPIAPSRAVDTLRDISRIINPASLNVKFIKAKTWMFVDLTDFVAYGQAAFISLQAVDPSAKGWVAAGPFVSTTAGAPGWSNLNFGPGPTTDTMTFCALGGGTDGMPSDTIAVYSSVMVRIIIDVYAFVVDSRGRVNPGVLGDPGFARGGASQYEQRLAQIAQQPKV